MLFEVSEFHEAPNSYQDIQPHVVEAKNHDDLLNFLVGFQNEKWPGTPFREDLCEFKCKGHRFSIRGIRAEYVLSRGKFTLAPLEFEFEESPGCVVDFSAPI